jgi:hypothetical protein
LIHPEGSGDCNDIAGKIRGRDRTARRIARPLTGLSRHRSLGVYL